ncbi:nucleoside deaminase [Rhizobacter sp. J219]|uniref:nucleoside deaminase n=1 Tax=Rhizobacter sp. J219 TaxID=2898430 RepID=UPI002151E01D|nr:nucleoside deaminase [Rhizobacter sp. J219]MCR5884172.1 nucleoside deaminase [Rhizobacter sp. J219]
MYHAAFMQRAIALSQEALTHPGTEPFGAVVVKDGRIVGEGWNHSLVNFDPTSHGEVEALRDACWKLQTVDLTGCELLHLMRALRAVRGGDADRRHRALVLRRLAGRVGRSVRHPEA